MKRIFISLIMAALLCPWTFAQGWMRQPTPNDTLRSTVLLPGGGVVFQIYAPSASSVAVTGDLPWNNPVRFAKAENGVWKGRLDKIDEGFFRYNFIVDGVSVLDPKSELAGETRALLEVCPSGDEFFAFKDVPHGAVAKRYYHSETLGTTRRLHVWTPAGYEKSEEPLPVLYLIHGGGDNDASWPTVGAAGNILDNLLAEGKIVPMIVVMPNGTIQTDDMMGEVPLFGQDMVKSIIPFIEANYNVIADKDHRAMAGLSMGGMETMETAFLHPELFSYVWVLSSSFSPGNQKPYVEKLNLEKIAPVLNESFKILAFTQGGPEDIAYNNCKETLGYLDAAGIIYEFSEGPGGHSWYTWRRDLKDLAPRLFK